MISGMSMDMMGRLVGNMQLIDLSQSSKARSRRSFLFYKNYRGYSDRSHSSESANKYLRMLY